MSIQMRGGNQLIDAVKSLQKGGIRQDMIIADLGCGTTGHFVFPAAHLVGPQGKIYAVDILTSVLESIESRRKIEGVNNVETLRADLEKAGTLKITNQSVDLAILTNILSQVQSKDVLLNETARITKTSGTLLITDWKTTQIPFGPPTEKRLNPTQVKQLAQNAGFEFVEEFEPGPYHFGMVFLKK